MANFPWNMLQGVVARARHTGIERCDDWACRMAAQGHPDALLDVGCGDGSRMLKYLRQKPRDFCGVEGSPDLAAAAERNGLKICSFDLNGRWTFEDDRFDVVFSNQVIEHVHNCRLFASEALRVLKPGGLAVVTTENLCSLLNCAALLLGYTPFSLMQTCGRYLGNPLGLHYNEPLSEPLPLDHPAFSGVAGHVRVLTVRQALELFEWVGFEQVRVRSISILPLPDRVSQWLEGFLTHRGHYMMIQARKPLKR